MTLLMTFVSMVLMFVFGVYFGWRLNTEISVWEAKANLAEIKKDPEARRALIRAYGRIGRLADE